MKKFVDKVREAPLLELSASLMFTAAAVLCVVLMIKLVML